jgi:membrane protein
MPIFQNGGVRRRVLKLLSVQKRLTRHRSGLLAAGVAFYGLLSLFPGLAAVLALAGIWLSPTDILSSAEGMQAVLPDDAAQILLTQLNEIATAPADGLGLTAMIGFAIALYSASRAVGSMVEGIRAAHETHVSDGWLTELAKMLALTFGLVCAAVVTLVAVVVIPVILNIVFPSSSAAPWIALLRWPVVAGFMLVVTAAIYRVAHRPDAPGLRFVTMGAVGATIGILGASVAFSAYVENFANYNQSFGALGGVITLLTWLWLSAYIVIAGAEFDALDIEIGSSAFMQVSRMRIGAV